MADDTKAEPASAEERRALLAGRLSSGHDKASTIAVIEQAILPAKPADRYHSRQWADPAPQLPTKPRAAQEAARPAPRYTVCRRDRELDYGR
jgi:hypothetical protein